MAAPVRGNFTKKQGTGATAAINTTGANTLVVVFFSGIGSTPSISSDTYGNTWTLEVDVNDGGERLRIYKAYPATTGAGHTVTPAGTDGPCITHFVAYSGATGVELPGGGDDTSPPFAVPTGGPPTGSPTTVADSLIFTAGIAGTGATPNVHTCTPGTMFSEEQDYGTYWAGAVADETVSTTGTKTHTWSVSSSPAATHYLMGILVIKGTTSGLDGTVDSAASATALSTPAGVQTHVGTVAGAASANPTSAPTGVQTYVGVVDGLASAHPLSTPAGALVLTGTMDSLAEANALSSPTGVQTHTGAVAALSSAEVLSAPAGVQTHEGTVAGESSDHPLQAIAGTQAYVGQVAGAVNATFLSTVEGPSVGNASIAPLASDNTLSDVVGVQTYEGSVAGLTETHPLSQISVAIQGAVASMVTDHALSTASVPYQGAVASMASSHPLSSPAGSIAGSVLTGAVSSMVTANRASSILVHGGGVCPGGTCGIGGWGGPLPGDPDSTNVILSAVPAFGGIDVSWSYPGTNPEAVAYTKLYRSGSSSFDAAVLHSIVAGSFFYDRVDADVQYWYWIEIVSVNGTVGSLIGPATAIARPLIADMIERLTGQIDAGLLATTLRGQIDGISLLNENLLDEITARENENITLADAIADAAAGTAEALTFITNEIASRVSADEAIAENISIVAATLGSDFAAVTTAMQVDIDAVSGSVDAMYTAKVTVNGLVGGFGIHNDGASVEAGFDVDTFWVGRTSADKRKPFIISGGVVYIDEAAINSLTFSKLKDEAGSFIVSGGRVQANYLSVNNASISGNIYSDNWIPSGGTAGWLMERSGALHAHSGYFRGDIHASSIAGNTVNADHVISGSLNKFYTGTGAVTGSSDRATQCIRLYGNPGVYITGSGDSAYTVPAVVDVKLNGSTVGQFSGNGQISLYGIGAGTYAITLADVEGSAAASCRIDMDVIIR